MGKKKAVEIVVLRLTAAQARELRNSIEGWLDAGSLAPGDRETGIEGAEREALETTINQINAELYR